MCTLKRSGSTRLPTWSPSWKKGGRAESAHCGLKRWIYLGLCWRDVPVKTASHFSGIVMVIRSVLLVYDSNSSNMFKQRLKSFRHLRKTRRATYV